MATHALGVIATIHDPIQGKKPPIEDIELLWKISNSNKIRRFLYEKKIRAYLGNLSGTCDSFGPWLRRSGLGLFHVSLLGAQIRERPSGKVFENTRSYRESMIQQLQDRIIVFSMSKPALPKNRRSPPLFGSKPLISTSITGTSLRIYADLSKESGIIINY